MKIICVQCQTRYRIDERRLPKNGKIQVKCNKCNNVIRVDLSAKTDESYREYLQMLPEHVLYGDRLKEEVLRSFKKLYPMAHIMWKVRALAADPEVDLKKICDLLRTDQAIAVRLLKVANSAYFGLRGKVSSIHHAAAVLGIKRLVQIIILIGNSKMLHGTLPGYGIESGTMWRHALSVAAGSEIIIKKMAPLYSGEAFLAGLLHDGGKMILDQYLDERKEAYTMLLSALNDPPVISEKKVLGIDHAVVGRLLCNHWELPDSVADAIARHHSFSPADGNILANILYASNVIANGINPALFETNLSAVPNDILNFLNINASQLDSLAKSILEAVEALEETTY